MTSGAWNAVMMTTRTSGRSSRRRDVDQRDVDRRGADELQGRLAVLGGADHLDALLATQQQLQGLGEQPVVVHHQDADRRAGLRHLALRPGAG